MATVSPSESSSSADKGRGAPAGIPSLALPAALHLLWPVASALGAPQPRHGQCHSFQGASGPGIPQLQSLLAGGPGPSHTRLQTEPPGNPFFLPPVPTPGAQRWEGIPHRAPRQRWVMRGTCGRPRGA